MFTDCSTSVRLEGLQRSLSPSKVTGMRILRHHGQSRRLRTGLAVAAASLAAVAGILAVPPVAGAISSAQGTSAKTAALPPVKHVWLIILENKSYDATFTGLNHNTYLWKTLPRQGVLLENYYGTGHFSLDNYISLVSGQATQPDTQADCPTYKDFSATFDKRGTLRRNRNYGQATSTLGPNAAAGTNGCVYPSSVATLFNQFSKSGVSWKGYAQDLGNTPGREDGPCGAPSASPTTDPVPNPGAATATDQYVPKHFPFPWFHSLIDNPANCTPRHISNLFSTTGGLYHDLQRVSTTPNFSWITPDNCSDAHDAVCHGNNLSGGFANPTTPNPPINYTGGLYASDLFLQHVVPEIEQSPAFKDNGLIDITFDEAFPPFTYSGNSFANSTTIRPDAATSIADDTAGQNINGRNVHAEPTGPNTPLARNAYGQELFPGPGNNAYIDRDTSIPGLVLGGGSPIGGSATGGARVDKVTGTTASTSITDNSIGLIDNGRSVYGPGIPNGCVVNNPVNGHVDATTPSGSGLPGSSVVTGSFTLDCNGVAAAPTAAVTSVNLGPETSATDPLYSGSGATNGGGDTGSVLISRYIKPGTATRTFYNHYSWLRTMEDLFQVDARHEAPGIDGRGHLGYAAQIGLKDFGTDVFTNTRAYQPEPRHHGAAASAGIPAAGVLVAGGATVLLRRRRRQAE